MGPLEGGLDLVLDEMPEWGGDAPDGPPVYQTPAFTFDTDDIYAAHAFMSAHYFLRDGSFESPPADCGGASVQVVGCGSAAEEVHSDGGEDRTGGGRGQDVEQMRFLEDAAPHRPGP